MYLVIDAQKPEKEKIRMAVEVLKNGGIVVYPTDTIYSIGCDPNNAAAIETICRIKNVEPEAANFSMVFNDLKEVAEYTLPFSTSYFKIMKRSFPGPFTFILKANKNIPRIFKYKRATIGVRIPDNQIARALVKQFGRPVISTSVYHQDEILGFMTDPEMIYEHYYKQIDVLMDGGIGQFEPSTVVDLSNGSPEVIRQGRGILEL